MKTENMISLVRLYACTYVISMCSYSCYIDFYIHHFLLQRPALLLSDSLLLSDWIKRFFEIVLNSRQRNHVTNEIFFMIVHVMQAYSLYLISDDSYLQCLFYLWPVLRPSNIYTFVSAFRFTYEIAPVFTLVEKATLKKMRELIGYTDGDGIFCPGKRMEILFLLGFNLTEIKNCNPCS